jgi:hypothetical protein
MGENARRTSAGEVDTLKRDKTSEVDPARTIVCPNKKAAL